MDKTKYRKMKQIQLIKGSMTMTESVIFLLIFVLPFPIICLSPPEKSIPIQYAFLAGYIVLFAARFKYLKKIFISGAGVIAFLYMVGAILKYIEYGHLAYTSVVLPLVAFFGYYYIEDKHMKLKVFDVLMITLYVFFIITYFAKLPSFFMRVKFEDGAWYGSSSSNAIAIILVNILYIYEVLTYLQKEDHRKQLCIYSIINLILIISQQSRAGILVSIIFVVWNFYQLGKTKRSPIFKYLPWVIGVAGIIWLFNNKELINEYVDVVGDMSLSSYQNDGRNRSLQVYFNNMTFHEFLYGYPIGTTDFANNSYTFNVFIDHWNKYTIIGFVLTIIILLFRIINYKKYYYPLYYLLPFVIYGWVEPRYLPNYWDFFLYLMLFKKCVFPKRIEALFTSQRAM